MKEIYTVRIVYKSGYTHDFKCTDFKINGGTYTWEAYEGTNKPLQLGASDIAAVWQVGYEIIEDGETKNDK
jgi:hypothetical protein